MTASGAMTTVRVEPLAPHHLDALAALVEDPEVLHFTRIPEPAPPGFAQEWYARYEAGRREGTSEAFAAVDGDGSFLGVGLAPRIDPEAREVELGYIVARHARGRGVGAALLAHLTTWAFEHAGALRSELIIDVQNVASQRVAQRCGYVLEGVRRSTYLKRGTRVDAQLWSRLPSDR
jgi:RimJ/RimL family protein N-acetyltransferase